MPNKIKIKTVFLDMDGVIADFHQGVYNIFDEPYNYEKLPRAYDFWTTWNKPIIRNEVNIKCNDNFWANLPWTHDGHQILDAILKIFSINQIYLLTVPMPNVESATGKMRWVAKNIPELYSHTLVGAVPKELLAKSDTLLIDDHDKYVDAFREAGGEAIRVNRPWNINYERANYTIEDLRNELKKYT